ncbi:MAG TPA: hypothetical protein VIS27_09665 [Yeosuana sp.]
MKKTYKNNKSSIPGISYFERLGKWQVKKNLSGKQIHLGYFADFMEAQIKLSEWTEEMIEAGILPESSLYAFKDVPEPLDNTQKEVIELNNGRISRRINSKYWNVEMKDNGKYVLKSVCKSKFNAQKIYSKLLDKQRGIVREVVNDNLKECMTCNVRSEKTYRKLCKACTFITYGKNIGD